VISASFKTYDNSEYEAKCNVEIKRICVKKKKYWATKNTTLKRHVGKEATSKSHEVRGDPMLLHGNGAWVDRKTNASKMQAAKTFVNLKAEI
jgi:hypothetical protein